MVGNLTSSLTSSLDSYRVWMLDEVVKSFTTKAKLLTATVYFHTLFESSKRTVTKGKQSEHNLWCDSECALCNLLQSVRERDASVLKTSELVWLDYFFAYSLIDSVSNLSVAKCRHHSLDRKEALTRLVLECLLSWACSFNDILNSLRYTHKRCTLNTEYKSCDARSNLTRLSGSKRTNSIDEQCWWSH